MYTRREPTIRWRVIGGLIAVAGTILCSAVLYLADRAYHRAVVPSADSSVSVEISYAPSGKNRIERVKRWIETRKSIISSAGHIYRIDPTAVAGVIGYEAIADYEPSLAFGYARFVGPGKVHYKENRIGEGMPVAKQVELRGYLPQRSLSERVVLLSDDTGAVYYIAAIMAAEADIAADSGTALRCDPMRLATLYAGYDLRSEREALQRGNARSLRLNAAGEWTSNNANWLNRIFGEPPRSLCETERYRPPHAIIDRILNSILLRSRR